MKQYNQKECTSSPSQDLYKDLMNPSLPKSEMEHYARNLIIKLQEHLGQKSDAIKNLQAENKRYRKAITEIERASCGEDQVAFDDTEGLQWIYKRIQALKENEKCPE